MRDNKKDQLQGTLDLLVLRILSTAETMHGFAITERIEQISKDVLRVEDARWPQRLEASLCGYRTASH